ncbi:MAG: hypothetical protein LBP22_09320 [Deltaproteobacteria bacterium]|jgi:hypothetical protein|nr:hypothetical protein [Deltaproteobacteria bacterium]
MSTYCSPTLSVYRCFGLKVGSVKLVVLAFLACLVLMGNESSYNGGRIINYLDHYNHIKVSASAAQALERGQLVLRTLEDINENSGHALHQFYSPAFYTYIGLWIIISGDPFSGYAIALWTMAMFGFIYSFKLARYLTKSDIASIIGAFVFITSPYYLIDRVLKVTAPEYMAISVLPMVLYYQLRVMVNPKASLVIKAVLSTAFLFLIHIIGAVFFYFFFGIFWGIFFVYNFIIYKKIKILCKNFLKRMFIIFVIGVVVCLLDMEYFYPILSVHDLVVKDTLVASFPLNKSGSLINFLSFFCLRNGPGPNSEMVSVDGYQLGLLNFTGLVAFIVLNIRSRSSFNIPIITLSLGILYTIFYPIIFTGPLKFLDFAQFSVRFLAHLQVLAMLMGAMALVTIWRRNPDLKTAGQKVMALIIILSSLVLVRPYLYPAVSIPGAPMFITSETLQINQTLINSNNTYMRTSPLKDLPYYDEDKLLKSSYMKSSSDRIFEIDLASNPLSVPGELCLDVLYYPGLMDIDLTVDGQPVRPEPETFWVKRAHFGTRYNEDGAFHGLKLKNLPEKGSLKVRVRFTGSRMGNLVSALTLIGLVCYGTGARIWQPKRNIASKQLVSKGQA